MKKQLLTLLAVISLTASNAQSQYLQKTCYRGAFAPAPAAMWTDSWTNWDPKNANYPAPTVTISANITANTTWSTGSTYLLQGPIYVTGNSILTIQPGVVIRGQSGVGGSGLFVTRGSQLMAIGTATAPIVFTSDQAPGARNPGDWGGVILMGNASNNNPNGTNFIEGIATSSLTQYGGGTSPNDNDNSGTLKYVRIEFGGYVYAPDKEINGLTMGAVGRGTTIDYVQCSFTNDDSFEWFGGTVNCTHLVAYRGVDDDFDTDNGFSGVVQFCLGVRDPQLADPTYANASGASTSEGFESDNDAGGTTASPNTIAIFSNVTDIGPLRGVSSATTHPGFRRGARIRRNSSLRIINSILMDHKTRGVYIDGNLSEGNAAGTSTNTLLFTHNIVANYGQRATESQTTVTAFNGTINAWVKSNGNDTLPFIGGTTSNSILVNPYNFTSPDYRPFPGSIAASGSSFTNAIVSAVSSTVVPVVSANIPSVSCIGSTTANITPITLTPFTTVTPNYCSLTWTASSGVAISNTTTQAPTFTITGLGTFTLTLTVVNENGTTTLPLSITTTTCADVNVQEIGMLSNVVVFPNPTSSTSSIRFNAAKASDVKVEVMDITGKMVLPTSRVAILGGQNEIAISSSELQSGIYFVNIITDSSKETVKLIVNH